MWCPCHGQKWLVYDTRKISQCLVQRTKLIATIENPFTGFVRITNDESPYLLSRLKANTNFQRLWNRKFNWWKSTQWIASPTSSQTKSPVTIYNNSHISLASDSLWEIHQIVTIPDNFYLCLFSDADALRKNQWFFLRTRQLTGTCVHYMCQPVLPFGITPVFIKCLLGGLRVSEPFGGPPTKEFSGSSQNHTLTDPLWKLGWSHPKRCHQAALLILKREAIRAF